MISILWYFVQDGGGEHGKGRDSKSQITFEILNASAFHQSAIIVNEIDLFSKKHSGSQYASHAER